MNSVAEIFSTTKNKTRVLIYTSHARLSDLVLEILSFVEKETAFYSEYEQFENPESDFAILQTSDLEQAVDFHPNIVFISEEINPENLGSLLKNITGGGVVIYPKNAEETVNSAENYFRKLPYAEISFNQNAKTWETEIGSVPLNISEDYFIKNLHGIQLLAQQFGVLDEEFFEPVMNFQ